MFNQILGEHGPAKFIYQINYFSGEKYYENIVITKRELVRGRDLSMSLRLLF